VPKKKKKLSKLDRLAIGSVLAPLLRNAQVPGRVKVLDAHGKVTKELDGNELVKRLLKRADIEFGVQPVATVCPTCRKKKDKDAILCRDCRSALRAKPESLRCPKCGGGKAVQAVTCWDCWHAATVKPARTLCPTCGGAKAAAAKVCLNCRYPNKAGPEVLRCACGRAKFGKSKVCKVCWEEKKAARLSRCPGCGSTRSGRKGRCKPCRLKEAGKAEVCACGNKKWRYSERCVKCAGPIRAAVREARRAARRNGGGTAPTRP